MVGFRMSFRLECKGIEESFEFEVTSIFEISNEQGFHSY